MATAIDFQTPAPQASQNRQAKTNGSAGNTVAFATDWVKFQDTDIVAALSGSATDVEAVVERSAVDPAFLVNGSPQGAQTSPADATGFTGDLSTGIAPNIYTESGVGWWRINVTTVTGGTCTATLSGKA